MKIISPYARSVEWKRKQFHMVVTKRWENTPGSPGTMWGWMVIKAITLAPFLPLLWWPPHLHYWDTTGGETQGICGRTQMAKRTIWLWKRAFSSSLYCNDMEWTTPLQDVRTCLTHSLDPVWWTYLTPTLNTLSIWTGLDSSLSLLAFTFTFVQAKTTWQFIVETSWKIHQLHQEATTDSKLVFAWSIACVCNTWGAAIQWVNTSKHHV